MQIGDYKILDRIGVGGTGEVFRAIPADESTQNIVVIKRLLPNLRDDPAARDNFDTEADLGRRLKHPGLIQQLGVGMDGNDLYLILEYVDGPNLQSLNLNLRKLNLSMPQATTGFIVTEILTGLQFAHDLTGPDGTQLNLVHRDVNPHNVLLSYDGRVVLADFGVARVQGLEGGRSDDAPIGKLGYLSPEQLTGKPINHQTDVFTCGVLAYELFVGIHPFVKPGDSDEKVARRIVGGQFTPPHVAAPDLSKGIGATLKQALAPRPRKRFQSANEMRVELTRYLDPTNNNKLSVSELLHRLFPRAHLLTQKKSAHKTSEPATDDARPGKQPPPHPGRRRR